VTTPPPQNPKIYHILHVDRLPSILTQGRLYSDAEVRKRGLGGTTVGMQKLKDDRLTLPVPCHPGTMVGDYVPFYFCSRSVMLFLLHKGNHENLDYRGGQEPIITLECDLSKVVAEADKAGHRWAFSLGNAAAAYQEFRADLANLHEVRWDYVATWKWSGHGVSPDVKEGKQAEFLVHERFPWRLVSAIGVLNVAMQKKVAELMQSADHRPPVHVRTEWYY
jgi:hypothetical protein